jgi:hypothetical protein
MYFLYYSTLIIAPLEQLKSQIGEQIQEDFKQSRYPCYCRFLIRKEQNPEWHLKAVSFI